MVYVTDDQPAIITNSLGPNTVCIRLDAMPKPGVTDEEPFVTFYL